MTNNNIIVRLFIVGSSGALYSSLNDPDPKMIPNPDIIPNSTLKRSPFLVFDVSNKRYVANKRYLAYVVN